jgi:hypothetical protein
MTTAAAAIALTAPPPASKKLRYGFKMLARIAASAASESTGYFFTSGQLPLASGWNA